MERKIYVLKNPAAPWFLVWVITENGKVVKKIWQDLLSKTEGVLPPRPEDKDIDFSRMKEIDYADNTEIKAPLVDA